MYPVETSLNKYQCSSEGLQDVITLIKADGPLYEFTATVTSRSDLISNNMMRVLFEMSPHASYVDNIRLEEIDNIISDINNITNSKL